MSLFFSARASAAGPARPKDYKYTTIMTIIKQWFVISLIKQWFVISWYIAIATIFSSCIGCSTGPRQMGAGTVRTDERNHPHQWVIWWFIIACIIIYFSPQIQPGHRLQRLPGPRTDANADTNTSINTNSTKTNIILVLFVLNSKVPYQYKKYQY